MVKIVIFVGHPQRDSYCEALGEAYLRGAEEGGHTAQLFVLGKMKFDPILREGYRRPQPLEADLAAARDAFLACDHVVYVFPLWCGDMPAIMKGFIERLIQPDLLAINAAGPGADWKVFRGKSARVIMTMGMPGWFYRFYYGAHALKLLKRNILHFTGISPVRSTIYGMVATVSDDTRKEWLREVEAIGHVAR
jgi:NAD(P)H dehydrogenase (quinone)